MLPDQAGGMGVTSHQPEPVLLIAIVVALNPSPNFPRNRSNLTLRKLSIYPGFYKSSTWQVTSFLPASTLCKPLSFKGLGSLFRGKRVFLILVFFHFGRDFTMKSVRENHDLEPRGSSDRMKERSLLAVTFVTHINTL